MCSARRRSRSSRRACASSPPATTSAGPTRPARRSSRSPAMSSSPRRPSACRCSIIPTRRTRSAGCCTRLRQFPERTHLVGAYALGKAQRVIRLLRDAGYDRPIYIHGALARLCDYYVEPGHRPRRAAAGNDRERRQGRSSRAPIVVGPPSAFADRWARRFPDPISCFASGWMRIRQRAKQRGVELPLIISDHCRLGRADRHHHGDWSPARSGSRMAARKRWCAGANSKASPRGRCIWSATRTRGIDGHEPLRRPPRPPGADAVRNGKLTLLTDYFRERRGSRPRPGAGRHHRRPQAIAAVKPAMLRDRWSPSAWTRCCSAIPTTMSAISPRRCRWSGRESEIDSRRRDRSRRSARSSAS